jgi:very-short-patch-repair endonuclease
VFRRQHPIEAYVLDFYCAKARLAIEIDGGYHGLEGQYRHDQTRDLTLGQMGIYTYRVVASDLMNDPDELALGVINLAIERKRGFAKS